MALQVGAKARTGAEATSAPRRPCDRVPRLDRSTYAGIALVAAIQAAVISWYAAHNWFFVDDFIFLRQAKDDGLTISFLRMPLFEHFSPVHRIADWLLIHLAGPSWPVAAAVLVALTVGCTIGFAYLVLSVTRESSVVVLTTAFYALSLFFIRTSIWWTAGVHILCVTLFSIVALGGYARWHSRRSVPSLVLSLVAFELALLSHEDAMLLGLFLVLLRLLVLVPHPRSVREVYSVFRDDIWVWVAYGLLNLIALWNFFTWFWQRSNQPSLGDLLHYLWLAITEGFLSTLFFMKIPETMVRSPTLTGEIALAAGIVLIGVTLITRVGSWRSLLFFALTFIATALPLGLSRIEQFGVIFGTEPIYQLGPAYLFLFALAVAFSGPRRFGTLRGSVGARFARSDIRIALACAAAVLFLGAYLRATELVVDRGGWQAGPTREYFTNLRKDASALSARGIHPEIFDQPVPSGIVLPWEAPFNRTAINLMVPSIKTSVANAQYVVTPVGHLQRVDADEQFGESIPAPVASQWGWGPVGSGSCMAPRPGARPVTLVLPKPLKGTDFVVRIQARGARDVDAIVYADNRAAPVTLRNGTNYAYFTGPSISQVGLTPPDSAMCIERISVAELKPSNS